MPIRIMSRTAFFTLAAVACAALPASQVSAQQSGFVSPLVQECRDAYDGSPANARCTSDLWAHAVAENSGGGPSHTCWVTGKCALIVPVGDTETTFYTELPYHDPMYLSPAELANLDLCFGPVTKAANDSGWGMKLKPGCGSNLVDSATALAEGLKAPSE